MKILLSIIAVAVAVILSTIADIYLKKSELSNIRFFVIGLILYAVAALPIAAAFRLVEFSLVFYIWEALAILSGTVLGIAMFKESFSVFKVLAFATALISLLFSYLSSVIK